MILRILTSRVNEGAHTLREWKSVGQPLCAPEVMINVRTKSGELKLPNS